MMNSIIPGISVAFDNIQNLWGIYTEKPTVVVIGSGWGATAFTEHIHKNKYKIKVISKTSYRLNQPRLIPDFKPSYKKLAVETIIDNCLTVDFENNTVKARYGNYEYNYLVLATGSESNDFGISGVKEYCIMFKTESDLERLQNILSPQSKITVIGAGPTGLELAFKLQSMGHKVTIIEAGSTILPGFSDKMQKKAMAILEERNIQINLNMRITKITKDTFITPDEDIPRDKIVLWTAGVRPTSFVRDMNKGKSFKTDGFLNVRPNVYALGDIVHGHGPPTAQNAKQQGKYLATYFNSDFKLSYEYKYKEAGRVLDIGDGLLLEYNSRIIRLPSLFRVIFYRLAD